jgi:hypothetical protein
MDTVGQEPQDQVLVIILLEVEQVEATLLRM